MPAFSVVLVRAPVSAYLTLKVRGGPAYHRAIEHARDEETSWQGRAGLLR